MIYRTAMKNVDGYIQIVTALFLNNSEVELINLLFSNCKRK